MRPYPLMITMAHLMAGIFALTPGQGPVPAGPGWAGVITAHGPQLVSMEAPDALLTARGQTVVELESGPHYPSGTRVGSTSAGVSFVVPDGWHAAMPPGSETVFLESPRQPGVGLVAIFRDIAPQELEDHLNEPQVIDEGYVLHPVESAKRSGDRITVTYHGGDNTGRALAVLGPSRNGILYLLTGPKDRTDYYGELVQDLAASTQFSEAGGRSRPEDRT